jgi:hypothetical protein
MFRVCLLLLASPSVANTPASMILFLERYVPRMSAVDGVPSVAKTLPLFLVCDVRGMSAFAISHLLLTPLLWLLPCHCFLFAEVGVAPMSSARRYSAT